MDKLILLERELISIRKDIVDLKHSSEKRRRWQLFKLKFKYWKTNKKYKKLMVKFDKDFTKITK